MSVQSFRAGRMKLRWFLFYLLLADLSLSKEVQAPEAGSQVVKERLDY